MSLFRIDSLWKLEGPGAWIGATLLFAVLLTLIFPEAVFQGKVFTTPDSLAPQGFASHVRDADLGRPLWNPFIFAGMPSYASLSYNPGLYPPSAALRVLIDTLRLPPLSWLLVHYLWCGLGIFVFLRNRRVPGWAAWLAGALFLLMPSQIAVGVYGHGSKVMTFAWLPWILFFADRLLSRRNLSLSLGLLAASLAGLLLAAHVQVAYYGLLALGLFALLRLASQFFTGQRRGAPLILGAGLLALLLAAGAAAVLYAPVQEYSHQSIRGAASGGGAAWNFATGWSLHPREWATFIFPSSFGFGEETYFGHMPMTNFPNYLGLLPVLVALLPFLRKGRRRFDLFWAGLFLMATLVAAGRFFPVLYRPFYEVLPWFNRFRVPVMILLLQQLALVILFARGLAMLWRDERARLDARWLLGGGALVFILSGLGAEALIGGAARDGIMARLGGQLSQLPQSQAMSIVGDLAEKSVGWFRAESLRAGLLLLPPLVLLELLRRGRRLPLAAGFTVVVALFLLADFLPLDRRVIHPENHWDSHAARGGLWDKPAPPVRQLPPKTLAFLEESLDGDRFFALPGSPFVGNEAAARGLASLGGYHAAKLARADSVIKGIGRGGVELLSRFSVRYLLTSRQMELGPDLPLIRAGGDAGSYIHENRRWRPRLFVEDRVVVEDPAASRARLLDGRATAPLYLSGTPAHALSPGEGACGRIIEKRYGLDEVACRVGMERPGVLALADMEYPGWTVEVDGEPATLLTADGFFRAVSLPAGEHEIVFRFAPAGMSRLWTLRRISFAIMALLVLAGAWLARRGPKEVAA